MSYLEEILNQPLDDTYTGLCAYSEQLNNEKPGLFEGVIEDLAHSEQIINLLKDVALGNLIRPNEIVDVIYNVTQKHIKDDLEYRIDNKESVIGYK